MKAPRSRSQAYRTIWRWHFYAGLFVIPFILLLAITGAAYVFKPQVERWEERAFHNLPVSNRVMPQRQVDAALAAFPGARFTSYRLPEHVGDAALIQLSMPDARAMQDVFVSPHGEVLGSINPDARLMTWIRSIHGQLLLGKGGSWLVELAASWAILLLLSGLYLWWPRGRSVAGVIWPRLTGGKRMFWRDLHAVTGFWISGLALVLLVTGLPWAGLWGSAFKAARTEMGWISGPQSWTLGGEAPASGSDNIHAAHGHEAHGHEAHSSVANSRAPDAEIPRTPKPSQTAIIGLNDIVAKAMMEKLAFPVIVTPPSVSDQFSAGGAMLWTVQSNAQNRPLRMSISYDMATGYETVRKGFADGHIIDRIVGYGIAWHEGQLFGWVNQLIAVLTAMGLIVMAVSGFVLWRRRKPSDALGAPPPAQAPARMGGVAVILLLLSALLPLLAASLALLWLAERQIFPRLPRCALWLGVPIRSKP